MHGIGNAPPRPSSSTALLVDDSPAMLQALEVFLRQHHDIEIVGTAADGQEAVRLARSLKPDLVIIDVQMPHMNGIDATQSIKALPDPPRVIVISLDASRGASRARDAGADAFCSKTDIADLPHHIDAVLGRQ
jgi:DNA-binding NarL/FixJ family response regulator